MIPDDSNFPEQSPPARFALPPKPRTSTQALTIGILIILTLMIGGGVTIDLLTQRRQIPPPPAPDPVIVQGRIETPFIRPTPTPMANGQIAPATLPTAQPGAVETDVAAPIAVAPATEWDRVQETYRTSPPELAIVALTDFLDSSPHSASIATAKSQIDEELDRLWWTRIKGLCAQRDDLSKRVADIDHQISIVKANGAVAERIAELQAERAPMANELALNQGHLDEMKYTDPRTPDLYDEGQISELRNARDAATFEEWKKKTLAYIQRNRGKLPW